MPLPKEERYTLADVLTWDEQERVELIDGAPVMMAPPSRIHQKISAELGRQLGNYLEGKKCEVYAAPFAVRLFEKAGDQPEDVDTVVEPDLSVVCDPDKLDDMGCKGAPRPAHEVQPVSAGRGTGVLDRGPRRQEHPELCSGGRPLHRRRLRLPWGRAEGQRPGRLFYRAV